MLFEEVKNLEKDLEFLKKEEIVRLKERAQAFEDCCKMVIPNKVYVHKERRNTTVKFLDGSQVTVKRRANEKNCIETAIAYCILKQLIPTKDLKKLIEEREEH